MFFKRTWAEIDTSALLHNYKLLKEKASGAKIMAVVKADAYGHGVETVVPALENAGVYGYAVSNLQEALQLRQLKVLKPILVLGYTPKENYNLLVEHNVSQTVYDVNTAKELSDFAGNLNKKINIHLKLDTGMSRLGVDCKGLDLCSVKEAEEILNCKNLVFEGAFTHFAVSDGKTKEDIEFTQKQFSNFNKALQILKEKGFVPKVKHCCNSAGLLYHGDMAMDICRAGIALYGLDPESKTKLEGFKPVMQFKSVVSSIKYIQKGDTVSYGRTFTAEKRMKIATVSAGYADGYMRSLSNNADVLINGKRARVIGRVCMDQFVVDASNIELNIGDEVLLFGDGLPAEEIAEIANTINYEVICGVSKRVPRVPK